MRSMNDAISLVCEKSTTGADGFPQIQQLDTLEVFAQINSINRGEFYAAEREGIKLALSVYINADDWKASIVLDGGRKIAPCKVVHDGITYSIYRTYQKNDTDMELILQEVE